MSFECNFTLPSTLSSDKVAKITLNYKSTEGTIAAPLVTITVYQNDLEKAILSLDPANSATAFSTYTLPDGYSSSLTFLAVGDDTTVLDVSDGTISLPFYWNGYLQQWYESGETIWFNSQYATTESENKFNWTEKLMSFGVSYDYACSLSSDLSAKYGNREGGYVAWLNDIHDDVLKAGFSGVSEEFLVTNGVKILNGSFAPFLTDAILTNSNVEIGSNNLKISVTTSWDFLPSEHLAEGVFGYGWSSSLDTCLIHKSSQYFTVILPDGTQCNFSLNNGQWQGSLEGYVLTEYGNGYGISDNRGIDYKYSLDGRFLYMQNIAGERITAVWQDWQDLNPAANNDRTQKVLTELKHSDGSSLKFTYNDDRHITSITSSSGEYYSYSYDKAGNLTAVYDKNSTVIEKYTYASALAHTLASSEVRGGDSMTFSYDEFGRIVSIQNLTSNQIRNIAYDGFTTSITDQNGVGATYTLTSQGQISSVSDSRGNQTFYSYDAQGNLLSVQDEAGNKETYTYNSNGQLTKTVDILGKSTTYTYKDDQVTIKDIYGKNTVVVYDDNDQIVSVTEPDGSQYSFSYDGNGFLAKITGNDTADVVFTNDSRGNITNIVSGTKNVSFTYDASNNVTSVSDAAGQTSYFTYNTNNQMTSFTDNAGNKTLYGYSDQGEIISITYANGKTEHFTYDSQGNMLSWTNMCGETIEFSINAAGNLASSYVAGNNVTVQYDIYGQMISANDMSFTYDSKGNILTQSYQDGRKLTYTYDKYNRLESITDEKGNQSVYAYDQYGNLDTVKDGTGNVIANYDYNSYGQVTKQTNGEKSYTTYTYNTDGSVKKISYYSNSSLKDYCEYSYNDLGFCVSKKTKAGTWKYEYNSSGRLTKEQFTNSSGKVEQENYYTYDSVGNRLTKVINGVQTTYVYNNMNQIVSANGIAYKYDANGNLLEDEERIYTWTKDNRVASETLKATGQVWTYGYDALGNRCSVTTNGVTTEYMVDSQGNVFAEYIDGEQTRNYYHGLSLIGFNDEEGNSYFYNQDMLSSTVSVTNSSGTWVNTYTYDAFGNTISVSENIENAFEFVGGSGLMQNDSGTIFVRARNYDSDTGRWISMDPLGIAGGSNLYEYCGSNPVIFIDETGYAYCPVHGDDDGYTISDGADLLDFTMGTFASFGELLDDGYLLTHGGTLTPVNDIVVDRMKKFSKFGKVTSVTTSILSIYDGITQNGITEGARRSYQATGAVLGSSVGSTVGKIVGSVVGGMFGVPWLGNVVGGILGGWGGGKLGGMLGEAIGDSLLPPANDCNHSTKFCPNDDDDTTQTKSDANKGREVFFDIDGQLVKTAYYNINWTMSHTAGVMMDGPYNPFSYEIRAFVGGQDVGIVAAGTACDGVPSETVKINAAVTIPAGLEWSGNSVVVTFESTETKYTASGREYIETQRKSGTIGVVESFNVSSDDLSCWLAAGANVLSLKTGQSEQQLYETIKGDFQRTKGALMAGNAKTFADFLNSLLSGTRITPKYAKQGLFSYLIDRVLEGNKSPILDNITMGQLAEFIDDNGPCVLSISNSNSVIGHAITVYGAHDNGDGTGYMLIADSDDSYAGTYTVQTEIDKYGRTHLVGYGSQDWVTGIAYTYEITGNMDFSFNTYSMYNNQRTLTVNTDMSYKIISEGISVDIANGDSASHIAIINSGKTTVKSGGSIENVTAQKGTQLILESGSVISGNVSIAGTITVNGKVNAEHCLLDLNIANRSTDEGFILTDAANLQGASFSVTVSNTLNTGRYQLASGFGELDPEFILSSEQLCPNNGKIVKAGDEKVQIGNILVGIIEENDKYYVDVISTTDVLPGINQRGNADGISWDGLRGYWEVEYSQDNFEHSIRFNLSGTQVDTFALRQGTWQYRTKYYDAEWSAVNTVTANAATGPATVLKSDADGNTDVFFANAKGKWTSGYAAQHAGILDTWSGTNEQVILYGKNKLADIFEGSNDANILVMTDDTHGDALFVDDIYTALPGTVAEQQARIAQIDEIRAGLGDDIVDMTSQRFAYVGDGVKIYGGLGNDTIWSNYGNNTLFGDAGNDRIVGGANNDVIIGGIGNDSMHGGGGD